MRLNPDEQQIVNNYTHAFAVCYPQRTLDVRPAGREHTGEARFRVIVDGDAGDRALMLSELSSSQRDFLRGKHRG